jgi:hypothetical protein
MTTTPPNRITTAFALLCVMIMSLGLTSCKKDENVVAPTTASTDVIMPLKVGNTWTYQAQDTTKIAGLPVTKSFTITNRIIGEHTYQGEKGFTTTITSSGAMVGMIMIPNTTDSVVYLNKSDGLYGARLSDVTGWQQILRFPASVNTAWTLPDITDTSGGTRVTLRNLRWTLVSVNANVTVPAGSFSCYQYQLSADTDAISVGGTRTMQKLGVQVTFYYAVNKGMIKTEQATSILGITQKKVLSLQSLSLQ